LSGYPLSRTTCIELHGMREKSGYSWQMRLHQQYLREKTLQNKRHSNM